MKYIVLLGDGMADYPVPELWQNTAAGRQKPNMDLAAKGETGLVSTIPQTLPRQ